MKFHHSDIVEKIRKKRREENLPLTTLSKLFAIPSGTISRWVRNIPAASMSFRKARENERIFRKQYIKTLQKLSITTDTAKVFCSLLYWCEGSKYPSTNYVAFSNSDEKLVYIFLFLLRKAFDINEEKLRIHLQFRTTHNKENLMTYWSKLLRIPRIRFYKPTITIPTKTMKRIDYKGTCTIKYFDVKLLLGIIGIYTSFFEQIKRLR